MNDIVDIAWRIGIIIVCFTVCIGCMKLVRKLEKKFPEKMPWFFTWPVLGVMYVFGLVGLYTLVGALFGIWKFVNPFPAIHNWLGLPELGYQRPIVTVAVLLLLHLLFLRLKIYEGIHDHVFPLIRKIGGE